MTPQDKAKELVEKYKPYVYPYVGSSYMIYAKICALIAVDVILEAINDQDMYIQGENNIHEFVTYYNEVKQEIEKL